MQPTSLMAPVFKGRSTADADIESLWLYLKEVKTQPLPAGMAGP